MGKGLPRSLSRGDLARQEIVKQIIKVEDLPLTVDGATGVGFGSAIAGGLAQGNLLFMGAVAYLTFSGPTSGDLGDTWSGDYGVGTTPAGDATISDGDVDIIQSTAVGPAVAEVSPRTRGTHLPADTGEIRDNTDGSLEVNINLLVDDADIGADGIAMTVSGEIHIMYSVLGDD